MGECSQGFVETLSSMFARPAAVADVDPEEELALEEQIEDT